MTGGKISNCENNGNIKAGGLTAGGIAGWMNDGEGIEDCKNSGNIKVGSRAAGGVVGYLTGGEGIKNCENSGNVETGMQEAGGIIGLLYANVSVTNVYNSGEVSSKDKGYVGGIIGRYGAAGKLKNAYNKGTITYDAGVENYGAIIGAITDTGVGTTKIENNFYKTTDENLHGIGKTSSDTESTKKIDDDYNSLDEFLRARGKND